MTVVAALRPRRNIKSLHRWLGLLIAPIAVVVGLSGSLLVFERELIRIFFPAMVTVSGTGEIVSASRIVAAAAQVGTIRYFRYPNLASEPVRAVVSVSGGSETTVLIDPYTGVLIGPEPGIIFPILFAIHTYPLSGGIGQIIGGFVGGGIALCAVMGALLWWQGSARWKSKLFLGYWRNLSTAFTNIHNVIGIYGALALIVCALTGAAMVFRSQLSSVAVGLGGVPFDAPVSGPQINCNADLDFMVEQTQALLPDGKLTYVIPPQVSGGVTRIRAIMPGEAHPNGRSFVVFDCRGNVLQSEIAPDLPFVNQVLDQLIYPLHTGFALGVPGRIAVFVAGLMPSVLSATGIAVWTRRRSRKRARPSSENL